MRKLASVTAAILTAAACLALPACLETKNNATLNPNGSAKVAIDAYLPVNPFMAMSAGPNATKPSPEENAKKQVNDYLSKAKGVDAWSDLTIDIAKDGRTHFKTVAYVSDISKFKLEMVPPVKWTVDAAGEGKLELSMDDKPAPAAPESQPKLTAEEISKKIEKARQEFNNSKPMMQGILDGLKVEATYTLPGKVTDVNIFTKNSDNSVTFTLEGKKMLEAMEKIVNDDNKMIASIKSGRNLDNDPDGFIEAIYGKKGPITAKVAGAAKPQFDFEKESAAAKNAQPEMLKKLGIDLKPAPMNMNFGPGPSGPR